VTFADAMTVSFDGEMIATWGGVSSPLPGSWTASH